MPKPHAIETIPSPSLPPPSRIPGLEAGDRLARAEFERRYEAMPKEVHAELIEGEVYMASPIRWGRHTFHQGRLLRVLMHYQASTPGTEFGGETTIRLDANNEPQPDAVLFILPACGGQTTVDKDDYLQNAPELVGEIAASSVSIDLHKKLDVYRRNKILEYVVWRVFDKEIDWFVWRDGKYAKLAPNEGGILKSETFPGLWVNIPALLADHWSDTQKTLDLGLASVEHAAFVARLQTRKPTQPG